MPAIVHGPSGTQPVTATPYASEAELQEVLAAHPELLTTDDEPPLRLVQREFGVRDAGPVDLLLVDREGCPAVVEAKLIRNPQARREVAGQVLDYASALQRYTALQLDADTEGRLFDALRTYAPDDDEALEVRRRACDTLLRGGGSRIIVAVDQAPRDLIRILNFLNDQTKLDIRLVTVTKYDNGAGTIIHMPSFLVRGPASTTIPTDSRRIADPSLAAVLEAYSAVAPQGFAPRGNGVNYRQMRLDGWRSHLHYEFYVVSYGVTLQIHLEADVVRPLATLLQELAAQIQRDFPQVTAVFEPMWSRSRGRVIVSFPDGATASDIASTTARIISSTSTQLTRAYEQLVATAGPATPSDGHSPSLN